MPIYEYRCGKCGMLTEIFLRSGEKQPVKCGGCGGKLKKVISPSGFRFKGTGWYVTDYSKKGKARKDHEAGDKKPDSPAAPPTADKTAESAPAAEPLKAEKKPDKKK
jgi:putative FmdB family regulatory protein